MQKRTLVFRLFGEIESDKTFPRLARQMGVLLEGDDAARANIEPVLLVGSPGGSSYESFQLYSFLTQLPQQLTTVAIGFVASAAVLAYLAGARRIATPGTCFLLHEGHTATKHPPSKLMSDVKGTLAQGRVINELIAQRIGMPYEEFEKLLLQETYFSTEEAMKRGLVHEIGTESFWQRRFVEIGDKDPVEMPSDRKRKAHDM